MANNFPIHHCKIDNPCPVLVGKCEGPDPRKWKYPKWMRIQRVYID